MRAYREACELLARAEGLTLPRTRLRLRVEVHPPTRANVDLDNVLGRLKAGLDGVFLAAGLDDALVDSIEVLRCAPVRHGGVWVELGPA